MPGQEATRLMRVGLVLCLPVDHHVRVVQVGTRARAVRRALLLGIGVFLSLLTAAKYRSRSGCVRSVQSFLTRSRHAQLKGPPASPSVDGPLVALSESEAAGVIDASFCGASEVVLAVSLTVSGAEVGVVNDGVTTGAVVEVASGSVVSGAALCGRRLRGGARGGRHPYRRSSVF